MSSTTEWRWKKQGLLIPAPSGSTWGRTHAALPIPDQLPDGRTRVYLSARDDQGRAQIGFCDCDLTAAGGSANWSPAPVLGPGELGAFDDSGVTSSCLVAHRGQKYLYYTGWTRGVTVPFYLYAGMAVSTDNGQTFERVSRAPILERSRVDPLLTASPFVLVENGIFRMWYVSAASWDMHRGAPRHFYHVRYAESRDGIEWTRKGIVAIDFVHPGEYAIARPCVVRDGRRYRMWYSWRGDRYRIGYAESDDGIAWTRMDDRSGIELSAAGWDSDMMAYPFVFERQGQWIMLYNGNGYGASGCGSAVAAART